MRPSGRQPGEMRAVRITRQYTRHAEGSVLIEFGGTRVLCTASVEELVQLQTFGFMLPLIFLLVAAITSQIPPTLASDEFRVPSADLLPAGLPKASIIKLTKLVSLHRQLIVKRIGALPQATVNSVLIQFRQLF